MSRADGRHDRGFVLLVTLGLLVIAAALLVSVARVAVRHSADAALAQQRLRREWTMASCRRAVLPFAEQILSTAERAEGRPVAAWTTTLRLNGCDVTLTVADEQAKANVNEMLSRLPAASVEDRLRDALSGTAAGPRVRLRPGGPLGLRDAAGRPRALPPVAGFGQVVADASPDASAESWRAAAAVLSVWGDGRLNVMRAGRAAMRAALRPSLTELQVERLLRARDEAMALPVDHKAPVVGAGTAAGAASGGTVDRLLAAARAAPADRAKLPLATGSTCHSLLVRISDGRRVWYDRAVADTSDPSRPRVDDVDW